MTTFDAKAAKELGHALLACGGRLVSRRGILDDEAALEEIARTLASGLQTLEGHLGRFVLAGPRPQVEDDGCGSPPPHHPIAGLAPAVLDGGD